MKRSSFKHSLPLAFALALAAPSIAGAACPPSGDTAQHTPQDQGTAPARGSGDQAGRISKDGTHAPLEQSGQGAAGGTTSGQATQGQGA